jgi:hypothetical protein
MYFFSALPKHAAVQPYIWLFGLSVRILSGSTGNTSRKRGVDDERNEANQTLARSQHRDSPAKRNVTVECYAVVGTRKKSDRLFVRKRRRGPASGMVAPRDRLETTRYKRFALRRE